MLRKGRVSVLGLGLLVYLGLAMASVTPPSGTYKGCGGNWREL